MTPTLLVILLLVVGIVLFCVSALESALFALREHRIPTIAGDDEALSKRLWSYLETKQNRLGHVLVLSALCNTGMAALGLLLVRRLAQLSGLDSIPLGAIVFGTMIVFCHLLPNLLANLQAGWVFSVISPPVNKLSLIVIPFERVLDFVARVLTDLVTPASLQPTEQLQDKELGTLVEMRRDQGALEGLEGEVIHEILKLGDKTAKDCMTPRVDAMALSRDLPPDEADRLIREQPHRRLPIYDGTPDEIVGVLDVLAYLRSGELRYREFIAPPTFVPETLGAIDLFQRHLRADGNLVIVLDEFGGFEGIVTRSDVIEHLVGDVAPSEEVEIQDLGHGRFLVSGSARLDELREMTGVDLETDGLDTIGGLVATHLGRIPNPGEQVELDPLIITIRKSTGKRIEELLLISPEKRDAGGRN